MKYKKILIAIVLVGTTFLYGFAVGYFRIIPYQQLSDLRNFVSNTLHGHYDKEEFVQLTEPAEIVETGLQRLLLKKVHLMRHVDVGRGGAMTTIGENVILNSNRTDETKDILQVFNMYELFQYENEELRVPTNYRQLLNSKLVNLEGFDLFRFRVNGLHTESHDDGSHTLYTSHHYFHEEEKCISYALSRISLVIEGRELLQQTDWETIFKAEPCIYPEHNIGYRNPFPGHMSAGKIINYDDETLLISVGNFSTDPDLYADLPMDSTSAFGKYLLIDKETGDDTIYAIGSRNSQGLFKDQEGVIWSTNHGAQGGDELNIIERGNNYGWPEVSYGIQYGNEPLPIATEQGRHNNYDKPLFAWMTAIAPTQLIKIEGDKFSLWKNDLIVGSLTGRSLHRLRVENGRVIYNEVIELGYRIRDISTLQNEQIVMLTDEGSLFFIEDGGPVYSYPEEDIHARLQSLDRYDQLLSDDISLGEGRRTARSIYSANCSSCHFLESVHDIGPHLNGLFGRTVGDSEVFNFSQSFRQSEEEWTPELLREFLLNPEETFPNNRMQTPNLTEAEADSIIKYLTGY